MKQTPSIAMGYLIAAAFAAAGAWVCVTGVRDLLLARSSSAWPTAQGQVVDAGLDSLYDSDDDAYTYQGQVVYAYEYEGKRYRCDRLGFGQTFTRNRAAAVATADRLGKRSGAEFAPGTPVTVHVNPRRPGVATLTPGAGPMLYAVPLAGLAALAVGLFLLRGVRHDQLALAAREAAST